MSAAIVNCCKSGRVTITVLVFLTSVIVTSFVAPTVASSEERLKKVLLCTKALDDMLIEMDHCATASTVGRIVKASAEGWWVPSKLGYIMSKPSGCLDTKVIENAKLKFLNAWKMNDCSAVLMLDTKQ